MKEGKGEAPSLQSVRFPYYEAALDSLLQESDVPHRLGRSLPLEGQVSLPGLVRVGDCVSLLKTSHWFGMRRNGNKSASYLMIGDSSSLQ